MNIFWQLENATYELHRYPKSGHDKSLQAWDSADELAVNYINDLSENVDSLAILNDSFGALNIGLNKFKKYSVSDSYVSHQALLENLSLNHLDESFQTNSYTLNSLQQLPWVSHFVVKLTKNLGFLEFQLNQIQNLDKPCKIVATGKTTQVTSSVLKLFERYFDDVSTSLAKKKSRLIFANHNLAQARQKSKFPVVVNWPEQNLSLSAHANVFSKEQIDIGGRFLAENLPSFYQDQHIVDLGCGNGLLGLATLKSASDKNIDVKVTFTDESYMAVSSAKHNVEQNFAQQLAQCEFTQDDCLTRQTSNSVDIILCNPPFHQQNAITEHIAQQMFRDAKRVLKPSGDLYVVANRHLPYHGQLKKHFGAFKVRHQNKKFIIYACKKA